MIYSLPIWRYTKTIGWLLIIMLPLMTVGCLSLKKKGPRPTLEKLAPSQYPQFSDDLFYDGIEQGTIQSLSYFNKMPAGKTFAFGNDTYDATHLIKSLELFLSFILTNPSSQDLNNFIRDNYTIYKSIGKEETGDVLFTGYYEPSLRGSLVKGDVYKYPVYAQPNDLLYINLRDFSDENSFKRTLIGRTTKKNTVVPYYTRREIGNGDLLADKSEILAYVDDPVDLFFLEIQGSGIVYLENGGFLRVHYHTKNGKPYKSIGRYLIHQGKVTKEEMSMQRIREYLDKHPDEITDIFNYNPSYVFFKLEEGGPYGCYSVEVTPERSIATDRRLFPACAMVFIETEKPLVDGDGNIVEWKKFGRFVLNQDTGGAIRGPGRADLFKGNGDYAEIAAGYMKHPGSMYFLVLKDL